MYLTRNINNPFFDCDIVLQHIENIMISSEFPWFICPSKALQTLAALAVRHHSLMFEAIGVILTLFMER